MKNDLICENLSFSKENKLQLAGVDVCTLADKYGTPLYLMDEDRIRKMCRTYVNALKSAFGDKANLYYASKACAFKRIYEIMREEGVGVDVVSSGEVYTAFKAGFPMENSIFHGNNKTDEDIELALKVGVGCFVVDNSEELYVADRIAGKMGKKCNVILRITPGIDPHTYDAVATGKVDSKFGSPIVTGQADDITKLALSLENINLKGFHCHIGSQVFDSDVYLMTADVMLEFVRDINEKFGFITEILDIGGGYGVRYTDDDPEIDIAANIMQVGEYINKKVLELNIDLPQICMEPGRSIVADSSVTVYSVGTVKKIPGYKNYVSVDGGMTDNPRFALYGSKYTFLPAARAEDERDMTCSVVGRCCESGDILGENILMPSDIKRGEYIACLTTGAYQYSMASNYNRVARPCVVMLSGGKDYLAVKRETLDDIIRLDV